MKIRQGFVSNSSTASFIIQIKEDNLFPEEIKYFLASKEDISNLIGAGFSFAENISLSPISFNPKNSSNKRTEKSTCLTHFVSCNEDEIISFLVKNNIPFKASCHYDHYYVSYKRDSNYILFARNFGIEIDTYGEDKIELTNKLMGNIGIKKVKPFEKVDKKEWLEDNKCLEEINDD